MKKWLLVSIALCHSSLTLFAANNTNQPTPLASTPQISIEAVNKAIQDKQSDIKIVDVRDAGSYAKGHITGAINRSPQEYGAFKEGRKDYPGLSKTMNYVYCYNAKCHLAQKACHWFNAAGYPSKEITGGYDAWEKANYPIERYSAKIAAK